VKRTPPQDFAAAETSRALRLRQDQGSGQDNLGSSSRPPIPHIPAKINTHELHIRNPQKQDDIRFADINGIVDLAKLLVDTKKNLYFHLVYQLLNWCYFACPHDIYGEMLFRNECSQECSAE
jgi:hypothetical protein